MKKGISDGKLSEKRQKAEGAVTRIFGLLAILLFTTLVYYSLGVTGRNADPTLQDESIVLETEILWQQAALCAVAFAVLLPLGRLFPKLAGYRRQALAAACMAALGFGIFWVATTATVPDGDQAVLMAMAGRCNNGDFSDFGRLSYMTQCPHQLGMLTVLRIFQALFGEGNYRSFQYFNACLIPLMVCSGYFITGYLTKREGAQWWYLCLVVSCFPMYGYLPFVYGEISSTALTLLAAWMLLSCLERFRWAKALLCGLGMGLAIALRRHSLIVFIAFVIVILVKLIAKATKERVCLLACLAAGFCLVQWGLGLSYRNVRWGDYPAQPNLLYVVMGLNDDYGHPGWSNLYNFNVFAKFDGDVEAITAKAKGDLASYGELFQSDKAYRNDFFTRKMNAQWQAPLYQCLVMNARVIPENREQGKLANWVYFGNGRSLLGGFMKRYQMLLYVCILFLLIKRWKKDLSMEQYVLLLGVFGNFLFSLMWEAKTRYVFPSLLMMLPYYAAGLETVMEKIWGAVDRKRNRNERFK